LVFNGDVRFRIEQDWNALNSSGQALDDRSRLRYRLRFGFEYTVDKHSSFGARIRTGNINNQQGPHITIGGGNGEFGLAQMGFEKFYYQYQKNKITAWFGKKDIPITKTNELFWNDNVFVEGLAFRYKTNLDGTEFLNQFGINLGHFIIQSNNLSFDKDSYFQLLQLDFNLLDNRFNIFPGLYRFKRVADIPDGFKNFELDYNIFHLGLSYEVIANTFMAFDYYNNLQDYSEVAEIATNFQDQRQGLVASIQYQNIKNYKAKKEQLDNSDVNKWHAKLTYANIQKYAIIDYFAQNDWVRWDYSSVGSSASRITNFQGVELELGYAINENMNLIFRGFIVEQLISHTDFKENGNRVRLDLNVKIK